jgi:hypothetical protein
LYDKSILPGTKYTPAHAQYLRDDVSSHLEGEPVSCIKAQIRTADDIAKDSETAKLLNVRADLVGQEQWSDLQQMTAEKGLLNQIEHFRWRREQAAYLDVTGDLKAHECAEQKNFSQQWIAGEYNSAA